MRRAMFAAIAAFGLIGCSRVDTGDSVIAPAPTKPAPDNTAVNRRDAEMDTKTPIDQKQNQRDVDLTAEIRRKILDTEDLSVNARNAKVIVEDGKVTLRGPVNSDAERNTLARLAMEAAGQGNVDNQLEVAAGETTAAPSPEKK